MFAKPTHCRTHATVVALSGSNPDFGTKIKRPIWAFDFCGGDEGIRTLDTLASILHFQCSALDQLCDVSVFVYSSSTTTSSAITSSITSAASSICASSAKAFSNSASISRNNGSSVPISKDSSPSANAGVSLYD